ncbi:MAG: hypothetical protein AB1644_00520 [Candidatus Zixiibacteriota bacterium]
MRFQNVIGSAILFAAFGFGQSWGQSPDVEVGEISTPTLRWGRQSAVFDLTNKTENLKFITVETRMKFEGTYLNASRTARTHYILEPMNTINVKATVDIPGNFGRATMTVALYDVVDTLDPLMAQQKIYEQPFTLMFHIPDPLMPYLQSKVTMPPMVGRNPDFDNEFSRVLLELLAERKTPSEIAAMALADSAFVAEAIANLKVKTYLTDDSGTLRLNVPVIRAAEADEALALAKQGAADLAAQIKKNMPAFLRVRDSLAVIGKIPKDTNAFMSGGVILYKLYPAVGALLLWHDYGQGFIAGRTPLDIFAGTDPCNAFMPSYMYAVEGGEVVNGTQYYNMTIARNRLVLTWGDRVPDVDCPEKLNFTQPLAERTEWNYVRGDIPDVYMFDTSLTYPSMRILAGGANDRLQKLYDDYKKISEKYRPGQFTMGCRYWFWNLVATHALRQLLIENVVHRGPINGQFRLELIP